MFFKESGEISWDDLDQYIAELIEANVQTVYAMAYNTRYMQLNNSEILEIHLFIAERLIGTGISLIVGHPYLATYEELDVYFKGLSKSPHEVASVSMLYPERYYNNDDIVIDFVRFPEKYGFKTLLHEMKLVSGFNGELIEWPQDLLHQILELPNVAGVKEDSKNDSVTTELIARYGHDKEIIVAGHGKQRTLALASSQSNHFSWLNGSSMLKPKLGAEFCNDLNANGVSSDYIANYIENYERPFFHFVKKYGWHMAHKGLLGERGYSIHERFPLPPPNFLMDAEDVHALDMVRSFAKF